MKKRLVLLLSLVCIICCVLCACIQQSNFEENIEFTCYYSDGVFKLEMENDDPKDITYYEMTIKLIDGNTGTAVETFSDIDGDLPSRVTDTMEIQTTQNWSHIAYAEVEMTNINHEGISICKEIMTWETKQQIDNILKEKGY